MNRYCFFLLFSFLISFKSYALEPEVITDGPNTYYGFPSLEDVWGWCDQPSGLTYADDYAITNFVVTDNSQAAGYQYVNRCWSLPFGGYKYIVYKVLESSSTSPNDFCVANASSVNSLKLMANEVTIRNSVCLSVTDGSTTQLCEFTKTSNDYGHIDDQGTWWAADFQGAGLACEVATDPAPVPYVAPVPDVVCPSGTHESNGTCVFDTALSARGFEPFLNDSAKATSIYTIQDTKNAYTFRFQDNKKLLTDSATFTDYDAAAQYTGSQLLTHIKNSSLYQGYYNSVVLSGQDSYTVDSGTTQVVEYWYLDGVEISPSNSTLTVRPLYKSQRVKTHSDGTITTDTLSGVSCLLDCVSNSILTLYSTDITDYTNPDPVADPQPSTCDSSIQVCPIDIENQTTSINQTLDSQTAQIVNAINSQDFSGLTEDATSLLNAPSDAQATHDSNQQLLDAASTDFGNSIDAEQEGFLSTATAKADEFAGRFLVIFDEQKDTTGIPYIMDEDRNPVYITHEDTAYIRMLGNIVMVLGLIVYVYQRFFAASKEIV